MISISRPPPPTISLNDGGVAEEINQPPYVRCHAAVLNSIRELAPFIQGDIEHHCTQIGLGTT